MKRREFLAGSFLALAGEAVSSRAAEPLPAEATQVLRPGRNVRAFGAVGDGVTKDTAAVQRAIDAGGLVYFPPGTYLCGTLYLKSHGGLYLEPGAVLKASPDRRDYNADDFCPQNRVFKRELVSGAHFLVAVEQEDIALLGGGRIDGNRAAFFGDTTPVSCERLSSKFNIEKNKDFWRPGQMIFFCECREVRIQDIQLFHAPYWTCFLHGCEDVILSGLRILNDQRTPNGDGIDVDCCRRVAITNCVIDSGDDCITLRGSSSPLKKKRACEYVTVSNCILHTNCNAFRIGVGDYMVRHVAVSNIVIHDTRTAISLVPQYSLRNRGVRIEDISFSGIQVDCDRVFNFTTTPFGPCKEEAQEIRGISVSHVRGQARSDSILQGSRKGYVSDLSFSDIRLTMLSGGAASFLSWRPGLMHGEFTEGTLPCAFFVQNVCDLSFDNVCISWQEKREGQCGILLRNSDLPRVTHCDFGRPDDFML